MKRLIKKVANFETIDDFLYTWTTNHYSVENNDIEKVVNDNADCIYSGEAYRFIELYDVDYEGKSNEELINESMNHIKPIGKYSSFASSRRAVEYFITTEGRAFGVILKANVKGLDIKQLASKYKDEIVHVNIFDYANTEDEVILLDEVDDFNIVGLVIDDVVSWI